MIDLLRSDGGKPSVDSKKIADSFGKIHRDVIRAIDLLECSEGFRVRNFAQSTYVSEQGKTLPCVLMTRDGFCFLAMGFTGKKAARWKESFLDAFNAMEEAIKAKQNGPMAILSEAVHAFEQDSKNVSMVGRALAKWKKSKAAHIEKIFDANKRAQMLIELEE